MCTYDRVRASGSKGSAYEIGGDGLGKERRLFENRQTAIFLIGFLACCVAVAAFRFAFYIWIIELGCAITCIAIFIFAVNIKDYTTDASSLCTGVGFLFTFAFEAAYLYIAARSGYALSGSWPSLS
jgi:hypothetical protein